MKLRNKWQHSSFPVSFSVSAIPQAHSCQPRETQREVPIVHLSAQKNGTHQGRERVFVAGAAIGGIYTCNTNDQSDQARWSDGVKNRWKPVSRRKTWIDLDEAPKLNFKHDWTQWPLCVCVCAPPCMHVRSCAAFLKKPGQASSRL